jgi:hypothetical protein
LGGLPGLILKTVVVALGCLVAADIVGALACTIFDILPLRGVSAALAYAIWLVIGVFCGLFIYNIAGAWVSPKPESGDWSSTPGANRIGTGVLITSVVIVAALAWLFYAIFWSQGVAGDDYVPDSEPHSIVFFAALLGGMAVGRFALMSEPEKKA